MISLRSVLFASTLLLAVGARAEAPKSDSPAVSALPAIPAPLGRIGDVVEPRPAGGLPGDELAVELAGFPGCTRRQLAYLSRFLLMGAAGAGEQIQHWLDGQPRLQKRLFGGKRRLAEAVDRARTGSFHEGRACRMEAGVGADVVLARGATLTIDEAPPALCKLERGPAAQGGAWLFTAGPPGRVTRRDFTGAVWLAPATLASEGCRPRLSAALFDAGGTARLRYHADFGGELRAELLGDACRLVDFRFDPSSRAFVATESFRKGCRPRPPR